jgi:hypothetical protein
MWLLTARQLREFALPGAIHPVDCPGCESASWRIPVGRRVWRGICKVGCGWFCDRVTMMLGIRCLQCLSIWYSVKVRCCKYRDKQITPTDRVSLRNFVFYYDLQINCPVSSAMTLISDKILIHYRFFLS